MKNKVLPLLAISLITLTSCKFLNIISSSEEEVDVYDLDKINNEDDISQAFDYKATVRFKDNEPLIPYVTLQEYANFYESHYAKGVNSRYSKSPSGVTWSVFKDDELYFLTEINFTSKQIIVGGSLDATFKDDDSPRDLKALNYGANIKYDGKYLSGNGFAY